MTALDAYELAGDLFGDSAGVWSPNDGRCVVGRWVPTGQLDRRNVVLRGSAKALLVMGEGATWEEAIANARSTKGAL